MYNGGAIAHYTDLAGFIGILSNKGFWLSDARYLNDEEELHNGLNLAQSLLQRLIAKNRCTFFTDVLDGVARKLSIDPLRDTYVCSFSTNSDMLEQWRAYARNGTGISIEFDLARTTHYPHFGLPPQYFTMKVVYDDEVKIWILLSVISTYRQGFLFDLARHPNECKDYIDDYIRSLAFRLSSLFVNFKHSSFRSEQEVRLVDASRKFDFYNGKRYRASNGIIVPYVCTYDTKLKNDNGEPMELDNLPVRKVMVGPAAHQKAMISSIKNFLEDFGYGGAIPVAKSCIPYRG
ncbi:DUF2971 domain-containing protein [Massilia putida]|uniref:DUF2971 domain-containing protein n=1 Tax=Massilia putida TaxID=1141883 RepID=UPI001475BBAE|nr:DUF2971 domain-containing protein [Massilia putida]